MSDHRTAMAAIAAAFLLAIVAGVLWHPWSTQPQRPTPTPTIASTTAVPAAQPTPTQTPLASPTAVPTPKPTAAPSPSAEPTSCHTMTSPVTGGILPDQACTPGAVNPAVSQDNISTTICARGWTATIRPPESYTQPLKIRQMRLYGFTDNLSLHEEDHRVPLEVGGSPGDSRNLWPEPGASPNQKDMIENYVRGQVCSGAMTLTAGQAVFLGDFWAWYAQHVPSK